jgi:DNA-directed RNA polymerase
LRRRRIDTPLFDRTVARNIEADERVIKNQGASAGFMGRELLFRHVGPLADRLRQMKRPGRYHREPPSLTAAIWDALRGSNRDSIAAAALSGIIDAHFQRQPGDQEAARKVKLEIGKAIERQTRRVAIRRTKKGVLGQIRTAAARKFSLAERRSVELRILREHGLTIPAWPRRLRLDVGNFAADMMIAALAGVIIDDKGVPAIAHDATLSINVTSALLAHPAYGPVLEPPPPWFGLTGEDGSDFVQSAREVEILQAAVVSGQMAEHMDAVSYLQSLPCCINFDVWQFVLDCDVAGALRKSLLKKAKKKSDLPTFKLDIHTALEFRDRTFYIPAGIDFRGRLLPRPNFNFSRADHLRGLINFDDGAPITDRGIWWLRVAVASAYDEGKHIGRSTFDKRIAWVEEHLGEICDAARTPVKKFDWLSRAADPVQFYALAQELDRALKVGPGLITRMPIGFDATCSGLMQYALVALDPVGAEMTNLAPNGPDHIDDVYTRVLILLRAHTLAVAADDHPLARWWLEVGNVDRAICKQLVMTYCYSSEEDGQRMQVYDILFDRGFTAEQIPEGAPQYLVEKTREAIELVCGRAPAIMEHLKALAAAMLWCGEPVRWVSPSGLPISNLYQEPRVKTVQQHLAGNIPRHVFAEGWSPQMREEKTIRAVAPNFIHSLDAAHLAFVANACARERIPLVTVHDNFTTLAPYADRLNEILRQELKRMYAEHDPLQQIHDYVRASAWSQMVPKLPSRGDYDLERILNTPYAFAP